VSESAETDEHDVYIEKPAWVDLESGTAIPLDGVSGVWIPAREIQMVHGFEPGDGTWPRSGQLC